MMGNVDVETTDALAINGCFFFLFFLHVWGEFSLDSNFLKTEGFLCWPFSVLGLSIVITKKEEAFFH